MAVRKSGKEYLDALSKIKKYLDSRKLSLAC